jgi:hypothetical protein
LDAAFEHYQQTSHQKPYKSFPFLTCYFSREFIASNY